MEERLGKMGKGRRERMRKGAIGSSSPQGMTSWSSSIKICFFQCHAKICAIDEQNVINWKLYLRRTKNLSEEKEGMVEREKSED